MLLLLGADTPGLSKLSGGRVVCLTTGHYRMEILQTKDNMVKSVRVWDRTLNQPAPSADEAGSDSAS